MGGSGGRARLCYWCGTLRAAGSTPTQRPGNRRSPLCRPLPGPVAAPDRTSRTQSEADPTAGRGEGRTAASRGACRPQPTLPFPPPGPPRGRDLPHRPKLSPDLRVSDEPLPAGQRGPATPISHSATASPLLLSQSRSGPFLGMIHYASYLEVLTSPLPSAARAAIGSWRPLLGHPAGAP